MRITIYHCRTDRFGQIGHQPGGLAVNKAIDIGLCLLLDALYCCGLADHRSGKTVAFPP